MNPENLLVHQHDREWPRAGGARIIAGQLAILHRKLELAGFETDGVGMDHLRLYPGGRKRQP